jgi:hypothetical protein
VPLLFVDVNLGLGKSDRIVVYEGDKSDMLAKKFALIHRNTTIYIFKSKKDYFLDRRDKIHAF